MFDWAAEVGPNGQHVNELWDNALYLNNRGVKIANSISKTVNLPTEPANEDTRRA